MGAEGTGGKTSSLDEVAQCGCSCPTPRHRSGHLNRRCVVFQSSPGSISWYCYSLMEVSALRCVSKSSLAFLPSVVGDSTLEGEYVPFQVLGSRSAHYVVGDGHWGHACARLASPSRFLVPRGTPGPTGSWSSRPWDSARSGFPAQPGGCGGRPPRCLASHWSLRGSGSDRRSWAKTGRQGLESHILTFGPVLHLSVW